MLLVLDIGNTTITLGVYRGNELLFVSRMAADCARTEDRYAAELRGILSLYGVPGTEIDGAAFVSAAPALTPRLRGAIRRLTGCEPLCVGPETETGITLAIRDPESAEAGLVAGCAAAAELFDGPCIVLNLDTAITFAVLDENRRMLGGAIFPGVGIPLDALTNKDAPEKVIENSAAGRIRSGVLYGTACLIDGMCGRMEQELGKKCSVVATGGLAREITRLCERDIVCCDTLLLRGLRIIYEKNRAAE